MLIAVELGPPVQMMTRKTQLSAMRSALFCGEQLVAEAAQPGTAAAGKTDSEGGTLCIAAVAVEFGGHFAALG